MNGFKKFPFNFNISTKRHDRKTIITKDDILLYALSMLFEQYNK